MNNEIIEKNLNSRLSTRKVRVEKIESTLVRYYLQDKGKTLKIIKARLRPGGSLPQVLQISVISDCIDLIQEVIKTFDVCNEKEMNPKKFDKLVHNLSYKVNQFRYV